MAAIDYRQYANLVTASEVVTKVMTNSNFDVSLIDSDTILIAEIAHLKEHLGDEFWGKLRLRNDGETLSTDETTLLNNYIKPCLSYFVKYEVLNDSQYNTTSSGVVLNDGEFTLNANESEFETLKNDSLRKGELLRGSMIEWLDHNDNLGVFIDYESGNNKHESGDKARLIGGIITY
tara:strand:+ start:5854 stop:6384 length:531 start_codon:yes stop_codon:yes gene_type:complete